MNIGLLIAIIVASLCVIGVVVYFVFFSGGSDEGFDPIVSKMKALNRLYISMIPLMEERNKAGDELATLQAAQPQDPTAIQAAEDKVQAIEDKMTAPNDLYTKGMEELLEMRQEYTKSVEDLTVAATKKVVDDADAALTALKSAPNPDQDEIKAAELELEAAEDIAKKARGGELPDLSGGKWQEFRDCSNIKEFRSLGKWQNDIPILKTVDGASYDMKACAEAALGETEASGWRMDPQTGVCQLLGKIPDKTCLWYGDCTSDFMAGPSGAVGMGIKKDKWDDDKIKAESGKRSVGEEWCKFT